MVSGLPRFGTSMMMKMLEVGGLELIVDGKRKADEDNPKGYFEFDKVEKTRENASWVDQTLGKGVKVISLLLYHLSPIREYKILFLERRIQEIFASQRKMLERSGKIIEKVNDAILARKFGDHHEERSKCLVKD